MPGAVRSRYERALSCLAVSGRGVLSRLPSPNGRLGSGNEPFLMVRVANGTATEEDVSGLNPHVPSARTAEYNDRNLNLNIFPSPPHPRAPASGKKIRFFLSFGR